MKSEKNKMLQKEFVPFTAEIKTPNFEKSINFYTDILDFKILRINQEKKFATLIFNGGQFLIQGQDEVPEPRGRGVFFRFLVEDIEIFYDVVKNRKAHISKPLEKMFYGAKRFYVEDPDGYQIKFIEKTDI